MGISLLLTLSLVHGHAQHIASSDRPTTKHASHIPPRPQIAGPKTRLRHMVELKPQATFRTGGDPDWMAVSSDAVWVSIPALHRVVQLLAGQNVIGVSIQVPRPCSGLTAGFGSLWIPDCGTHTLIRADLATGRTLATIPVGPADSEGCITSGAGSVWLATGTTATTANTSTASSAATGLTGTLSRIDPAANAVAARIAVPSGSYCPLFADDFVWITSTDHNLLIKVDPALNRVVAQIAIGRRPRFATAGAGAVWTLNQGDGTISRIDTRTLKLVANIPAGLPGHGGEIAYGFGSVWATIDKTPVTRIDAVTNAVDRKWIGGGGDSIRAGLGSIWLTNLKAGKVWRIDPAGL